jgi:hypothetical protein
MRAEESFAWGVGTKTAIEAGKFALGKGPAAKIGRRKAVALLAKAGPYGKLAAAGVGAIAGFRVFEEASSRTTEQVKKTEYGKEHPLAAELIGMGVGLATGVAVPVEAMFGTEGKFIGKTYKAVKRFITDSKFREQVGEAVIKNPAAREILKFKEAEKAVAKTSNVAVAAVDKDKVAIMKRLVGTLEGRVAEEKAAAIPLPGAVTRRGIATPEELEQLRLGIRTKVKPGEGVIKYTPEELARARESIVSPVRGGLPVPAAIPRPGAMPTPRVSGMPSRLEVPKKAIAIEEGTPNLPILRPDGSLVSLGARKVVPYNYGNIKSEEGFDRVLFEVAEGKKAIDVVQKVGEMEEGIARHSKAIPPKKITIAFKKKMSELGYDAEEVAGMNAKVAANIEHFSKKKEPSAFLDRVLRTSIPKTKKSKIDLSDLSTEEKLYNWAKTLTPQQRNLAVEKGGIPESVNRRIVQEQRAIIEGKPAYKETIAKESEEFVGSMGTGGLPKEDGTFVLEKEEFISRMMMGKKGEVSPKLLAGLAVGGALLPWIAADEVEAGVMSQLAKVFKPATFQEAKQVGKKIGVEYNGVQEGIEGPVGHLFTDSKTGSTFFSSSAAPKEVKKALEANRAKWGTVEMAGPPPMPPPLTERGSAATAALGAITAAAATFTLADIFSPREAKAAGIVDLGRTLTGLTATILKGAKPTETKKLVKGMKDAGLITKRQVDHCYVLPEPMKSINIIPSVGDIVKKKSLPPGAEAVVSPHVQFLYYTGVRDGQELMNNAGVQWASCQTTAITNTLDGHKTLMNILTDFIPGYKTSAKRVISALEPVVEKYHVPMQERAYNLGMSRKLKRSYEKEFSKLTKKKKFKKREADEGLAAVVKLETLCKEHDAAYKASEAMKNEYQAAWHKAMAPFASKTENSGTRVFLAAEDTANFKNYPWLKDIITWEEKAAAAKLKDMMEHYSVRVIEAGEKVITEKPFMHHAWHPAMKSELARLNKGATLMSPPMTKLHSRSAGYMPMVPDAEYSVTSYLQDVNIRLEAMEFWKKGQKDGWWAYKKWITENPGQCPEGLIKAFNQFEKGFKPVDRSGFNNFSETVYALEVARLLAFSESVPFKHSLKLIADLRVFGMEGVKAMPKAAIAVTKNAIKQRGGEAWLNKHGFGLDHIDEAVDTYIETGKLYRVISDISPFRVNEGMASKALSKFNEVGGTPTSIVERFDRSLSVIASMNMAAKRGMTPGQATYAIYDTILKSNFLSGQLNPSTLRNPFIRLMMIFQGTPHKILEQRVALHGRAWKGVADTLVQLRKDVIRGEQDFKWEIIKQGFGKQKDIFGNTLLSQSIREMVLVGTAITAAKYTWGADLSHHFFHIPYFKPQRRDIAIGASPLVNASLETYSKYMDEDYDEFLVSTFFNSWFDSTYKGIPAPIPVNFKKAIRLTENDIPEIYRDSKFRYLFGIPATHD